MQVPARQIPIRQLALAAAVAGALAAFLVFAASASAQATDAALAEAPVVEGPASPEPVPAPAPAPESTEASDLAAVTDSIGEEIEGIPAPSPPDPAPVATPTSSEANPVGAVSDAAVSAVSDAVAARPVEVDTPVRVETEQTTVPAPLHRVSKLVENASKTVAPNPVARAAQLLSEVTASVREGVDRIASTAVGLLPDVNPLLPVLAGTDQLRSILGTSSGSGAPSQQAPGLHRPLGISAMLGHPADSPEDLVAKYMAGSDGAEASGLGAPEGLGDSKGSPSPVFLSNGATSAGQHSNGSAPLDVPGPLPRSPGVAVGGSGASFFVPIAALLALLALVAPAIHRRLREAPDFPVPTPFVCALERPG